MSDIYLISVYLATLCALYAYRIPHNTTFLCLLMLETTYETNRILNSIQLAIFIIKIVQVTFLVEFPLCINVKR